LIRPDSTAVMTFLDNAIIIAKEMRGCETLRQMMSTELIDLHEPRRGCIVACRS